MSRPIGSLSLDLDNKWSYLKTHGDPGWESFPTYLDVVVPRFLRVLAERDLRITVFVVGQDAALEKNRSALASISAAGHEIGNHSFSHEPWLHLYSEDRIEEEIGRTEELLEEVTGQRPIGFRGPGFSFSDATLRVLARRGYRYDCSTFPTFLGPLARLYYFLGAKLDAEEKERRKLLFGKFSEGFRTLRPHLLPVDGGRLLEIPVTTMPLFRVPIHVSYLLYLAQFSRLAARAYFAAALRMCRLAGVQLSLLLHPLDFLGGDDDADLAFFPAMRMRAAEKVELVGGFLDGFRRSFEVLPMGEHAARATGLPAGGEAPHSEPASSSVPRARDRQPA